MGADDPSWGRALRSMLERRGYRTHKEAADACDTSPSNLRRWYEFDGVRRLRHGHLTVLSTVLGLASARDLHRLEEIDAAERAGVAGRIVSVPQPGPARARHAPESMPVSAVVDAMMRLGASRQTVTRFLHDCERFERRRAHAERRRAAAG